MKKVFRLSVIFSMLSLCFFLPKLNADSKLTFPDTEPEISMDFQDANLKDILKVFSIQSGLNFVASEGVHDRKITLYFDKVPLKKAMDKLFKANNLSYELDREANIFIVKDWGKLAVETVTKVFFLKYATVSSSSLREEFYNQIKEITKIKTGEGGGGGGGGDAGKSGKWTSEEKSGLTEAIKKLLSEAGSVIEDFRTNSLIVTDTPSRMAVISQVIAALDTPQPQVLLEVEMLDVSKNVLDRIGIKFGDITSYPNILTATFTGASRKTDFPFKATADAITQGNLSFASSYQMLLSFIKSQTDTKLLARPRILTLNNEPAEIRTITDEVIGTKANYDDNGNLVSIEAARTETGISLRVTPQINLENNEITMCVAPKVVDASISAFSASFRDPEGRETKSLIKVKDGETVIIGGLIRNDFNETVTKLPLLGDIPLIGRFFRHKNKDRGKERELLVFITPHIIKDTTDVKLAQTKKVMLPREQNAVSGVNRELVINSSLNTFEKKKR